MGFLAFITNNPIYFEKKICGEIRKFFASACDTGVTPENIVISEILRNLERIGGANESRTRDLLHSWDRAQLDARFS
jgi:hypothetical protein